MATPWETKLNFSWSTRLCEVHDCVGYFHTWELYSEPLPASILVGGAPAGIFSRVYGIVEFPNGITRVDPTEIHFIDEEHEILKEFDRYKKGETNGD